MKLNKYTLYFYLSIICSLINTTGFRPIIISFGIVFSFEVLKYNIYSGNILIIENILCDFIGIFTDLVILLS